MKCKICGKEATYSTETYDPTEGKIRTIYLCEEHQGNSVKQRKMRYNYRPHWQGNDCCMNCMHLFFLGPDGLICNVINGRVCKDDTCSAFKRRGYVINEGTPDERILERVKEAMDDKPMPILSEPILTPIDERLRDIGKVLAWLYSQGILMNGRDEQIEELLRNILKEAGE